MQRPVNILLIEDNPPTVQQLTALLEESLSDLRVVITSSMLVPDAVQQLVNQMPYDLIIVGHKLQGSASGYQLCEQIRWKYPFPPVGHFTSTEEADVQLNHLVAYHVQPDQPPTIRINKLNANYGTQLVERVQSYLYGLLIQEQLAELFGSERAGSRAPQIVERGSPAYRLYALCALAQAHWGILSERVKQRLRDTCLVEENEGGVRIGLS